MSPKSLSFELPLKIALRSIGACLILLASSAAGAAPPQVDFDVTTAIACRDVTTCDFAAAHPTEKLVQATLQISSLLHTGHESDLVQYLYRIESPAGTLRIVDHLPRTEVTSPIIGKIAVETKDEQSRKIGGVLSGQYPPIAHAELNAQAGSTNGLIVKYEMLPRKELLAASGTMNRERGVYFKLRPSPQTSLEGAKQFVCVVRVPKSWRGDCVQVSCKATAHARRGWTASESTADAGQATFLVGLYMAGDEEAQQVVAQAVQRDEQLTAAVGRHRDDAAAALQSSSIPGYSELARLVRPPHVAELKTSLLERSAKSESRLELPQDLRTALKEHRQSLQDVTALNHADSAD
jgi:hypothetical protein